MHKCAIVTQFKYLKLAMASLEDLNIEPSEQIKILKIMSQVCIMLCDNIESEMLNESY